MIHRRSIGFLAAAFALAACGKPPATGECSATKPCSAGQVCTIDNTCVAVGGIGGGFATGGGGATDGGTGGGSAGGGAGGGNAAGGGSAGGGNAAGGGMGGGDAEGGGSAAGGGVSGTGGGYTDYCGQTTYSPPYMECDAGLPGSFGGRGSCAPQDAGVAACNPTCRDGFTCVNGMCQLNGSSGPVQVTLRWNSQEDLDLHVDEPIPGSNGLNCEIYYGDPNNDPQDPSTCGALGSLDLDSEAGCAYDGVDIENIIYPPGSTPPSGTYAVRVDHYLNCDPALTAVPFELEARFNGQSVGMCGVFYPNDPDWSAGGDVGGGRPVMFFNVP